MSRLVHFSSDDLQVHGREVHPAAADPLSQRIYSALLAGSAGALNLVPDDEVLCTRTRADTDTVTLLEKRGELYRLQNTIEKPAAPTADADDAPPARNRRLSSRVWLIPRRLTVALDFKTLGGGIPELEASLAGLVLRFSVSDLYMFCDLIAADPPASWAEFKKLCESDSRTNGYSFLTYARERLTRHRSGQAPSQPTA